MKFALPFGSCVLAMATLINANAAELPLPVSDSGLVTVRTGQTVRVNVVNTGIVAESCSFSLSLVNQAGIGLTTESISLDGGESGGVQLLVPATGLARAHLDFSAQLSANLELADPMRGCYHLLPTLEVLDADGSQRVLNTAFTGIPSIEKGKKLTKVTICHKPGTPAEKTKVIPTSALRGHLGHGDSLGPCP
ncbi:MAG: hypothetical protein FIA97_12145 [Methylococcaceae bacterium]|nr:hypothetical protein [Methylococcaceae bacterium]